ncbi:sensor histidine kinase [Croceivirga thetidis]|uniref:Histidine kinase n=1 Tax=Croceivirga thetidis TaxID=2721623 RepID=A0ABX1GNN1_9FLAO|nr:histidine kinase [Croceivirga thetidis]NKI31532.1 histidine kinase [Croceivirga thetidis]
MMKFFNKKGVRKFFFRWMVVNVVYLMIKATIEHENSGFSMLLEPTSIFYYVTAFLFFMVAWEYNDRLIKTQLNAGGLNLKNSLVIFGKTMLLMVPMTTIVYYLALFPLRDVMQIICEDPVLEFRANIFRAWLLTTAVVFINLFYFSMKQRDQLTQQMENLKKEMLASQYASLKNQISPHFLFNSLNTLTSLMYEDRDLASDFVARLASSYRYILDNREHDLVSLEKELGFMDAFIFMMEVRHKNAVQIDLNIDIRPDKYLIPTLSLQMLVENALKHNLHSKERPLRIAISSIQNDALVVKNNLQKRELKEETTKLGLKNIKKRYAFYTNKQVLVREEEEYFEVIIPLLEENITKLKLKAIS